MAADPSHTEDSQTITRWVHEHARAVRGYLLGIVRQPDVADDLTQEVFHRAWQARERYRAQGHERAYLLTIADRLACDRSRRRGAEVTLSETAWQQVEPIADECGPLEALAQREQSAELTGALEKLSLPQRRVLLLRYYGNLEFAQIAETLEAPLSTVLSHCRRGLLALRALLVVHET